MARPWTSSSARVSAARGTHPEHEWYSPGQRGQATRCLHTGHPTLERHCVMARKVSVPLVSLLALLLITCNGGKVPLTLTIGSGAIALVQNGVMGSTGTPVGGGPVGTSLPVASTAGNALVLIAANATTPTGPTVTSMPTGFVLLASIRESTNSDYEVWVYLNNPGGIQGVTFQTVLTGQW